MRFLSLGPVPQKWVWDKVWSACDILKKCHQGRGKREEGKQGCDFRLHPVDVASI